MKKYLALCLAAFVIAPWFSSAQTVSDLQQQVAALLARIQALQTELTTIPGAPTTPLPPSPIVPTTPGTGAFGGGLFVNKKLTKGDSGELVAALQRFLAQDRNIYPEGIVSGTYGPLTVAAVTSFQKACGITQPPGWVGEWYGCVGPRTQKALAEGCVTQSGYQYGYQSGSQVGAYLKASPVSGPAPLTVTITATANTVKSCQAATYTINYGDGSPLVVLPIGAGYCNELTQSYVHTYPLPGAYPVTISTGTRSSTIVVNVGTGQTSTPTQPPITPSPLAYGTLSVANANGSAPFTAQFSATINQDSQCAGGTYTLVFGDGQHAELYHNAGSCAPRTYSVTHRYDYGGSFTAALYRGTAQQVSAGQAQLAQNQLITVSGASQQPTVDTNLTIVPGVDNNPRRIRSTFQIASPCSYYDLSWGDGTTSASQSAGSCAAGITTKEFTHTYTSAGTYTVSLRTGSSSNAHLESVSVVISN